MKSALFWVIMQHRVVIPLKMEPMGFPETSVRNTTVCCITSQKCADLNCTSNYL